MRKAIIGSGLLAACVAGSANAAFLGWGAKVSQSGDTGILDVYGVFDGTTGTGNIMLSVIAANITTSGFSTFLHNDLTGGAWAPQFMTGTGAMDSFVTIGSATGFANPTAGDPSFSNWLAGASVVPHGPGGPGVAPFPGWYNNVPGTPVFASAVTLDYNPHGGGFGVLVGRFVINNPLGGDGRTLTFSARGGWGDGLNPIDDTQTFAYIPTPGALALVGLAGLVGRRRRA